MLSLLLEEKDIKYTWFSDACSDYLSKLVVVSESILAYSGTFTSQADAHRRYFWVALCALDDSRYGREDAETSKEILSGDLKIDGVSHEYPSKRVHEIVHKVSETIRLSHESVIGRTNRWWRGISFFPVAVMKSISIREIGKLSHTPKCLLACWWLRDNSSLTNSLNFWRVSSPPNKTYYGKHMAVIIPPFVRNKNLNIDRCSFVGRIIHRYGIIASVYIVSMRHFVYYYDERAAVIYARYYRQLTIHLCPI